VADAVVAHRPAACAHCGTALQDGPVVARERRQVHELPPLRLWVREHQALHVRCQACQHVSAGTFPADAPSPVQYGPLLRALAVYLVEAQFVPFGRAQQLLSDLLGVQLARGTVVGWVQQAARTLAPVETAIKAALVRAAVLHHDETGVRRGGQLAWAHVASTNRLTHYAIHAKRGAEATDAIGILPAFGGVSVHDGWVGYRAYTACRHALCNVHHLRELTFLEEEYQQPWAGELKDLLRQLRTAADQARTQGGTSVSPAQRDPLVARYRDLLAANPPPEALRRPAQRGRMKPSPARNLLERLLLGQEQVLAFLDDLAIPSTTTRRSGICAGSRSTKKYRAASAATRGRRRWPACAAMWPRCANRATRSWRPCRRSSPIPSSILPSPDLLRHHLTGRAGVWPASGTLSRSSQNASVGGGDCDGHQPGSHR
jgi:transposase